MNVALEPTPHTEGVGPGDEDTVEGICAALAERGTVTVRLWGRSMLPFVWPGATVTIDAVDRHPLRRGDLVLRRHGSTLALHRLLDPATGRTQGDWFADPDPPASIVGRARTAVIGHRHVPRSTDGAARLVPTLLAPALRRARDAMRPTLGRVVGGLERNRLIAKARRAAWPVELELAGSRHLPLVRRYLLKRGQRPLSAVLAGWELATLPDADRFTVVAITSTEIVGSVTAVKERGSREGSAVWTLVDLWTDRRVRGLGIAREMVAMGTEHAFDRGASRVRAHVRHERGAAWRAFAAVGFLERGPAPDVSPFHVRMERIAPAADTRS